MEFGSRRRFCSHDVGRSQRKRSRSMVFARSGAGIFYSGDDTTDTELTSSVDLYSEQRWSLVPMVVYHETRWI